MTNQLLWSQVRGAARETEDLTRDAKNRVQRDWQDTKRGPQRMLDDSSAARQWDAERAPVKVVPPTPSMRRS